MSFTRTLLAFLIASALFATASAAQPAVYGLIDKPKFIVNELSNLDNQYMRSQRNLIEDIVRRSLGSSFTGDPSFDLPVLQRLISEGKVLPHQRQELQAMGIVLGDLLAAKLGMQWVIYEDDLGRSRALQLPDSDNFLFPVTMISRRIEAGNTTPVQAIFDKAVTTIEPLIPPKPFE
jgi:hypothetical protein